MILKRYHSFDHVAAMGIEEALSLVEYALEQQEEELLFQRWIHDMQFQISFNDFKDKLKPVSFEPETKIEDILEEVRVITTLL